MKKFKLLTTILATTTCVAPGMSLLTGCGNTRVSELAAEIKDATIQTFLTMCKKTHRNVWNEQEGFDFVVTTMASLGFTDYAGRDYWSFVPGVRNTIKKETGKDPQDPTSKFPNYGNIWYDIEPSKGMENAPKIILQTHLDSQITFASDEAKAKWEKNGINATFERDNDLIYTDNATSLGADGGMGIALLLTIAKYQNRFKHGGIRLLFTAGESEGISPIPDETEGYAAGASYLFKDQIYEGYEKPQSERKPGDLRYLEYGSLHPFGETKGEFSNLISISGLYNKTIYQSVGGISEMSFIDDKLTLNKDDVSKKENSNTLQYSNIYTIKIDNLHGGKSSKDIDSGYASALEMMMKTLDIDKNIQIISASSEPGPYNIARTATFTFASDATMNELEASKNAIIGVYKQKCPNEDWTKVTFDIKKEDTDGYSYGLSTTQSSNLIQLFTKDVEFGATDWFDQEKTLVRTSYNHGKLSLSVDQNGEKEKSSLQFYLICRSNLEEVIKEWGMKTVKEILETRLSCLYDSQPETEVTNHTFKVENPVWQGTDDNKLINLIQKGYEQFGLKPSVTHSHGWAEVGCFAKTINEKEWPIEMACLGIEINYSQGLNETVYTDSLNTLNKALIYTLENIDNTVKGDNK